VQPDPEPLFQSEIEFDDSKFVLVAMGQTSPDTGVMIVNFIVHDLNNGSDIVAASDLKMTAVDPLDVGLVVLFAAGDYAFCLASNTAEPIRAIVHSNYKMVMSEYRDRTLREKIEIIWQRSREQIKNSTEEFEAALKAAITPCAKRTARRIALKVIGGWLGG
jgi:hypothetical protein